jgi:endonuclease YncB( thermonuclease family)
MKYKLTLVAILLCSLVFAGNWVVVSRVIDGDTFETESGEKVRLIGIDTPETKHPTKPVEAYGKEAYEFTKNELEGKRVRLEYDWQEKDKYGRTLAYVYLEDGSLFNAKIIQHGYAHAYTTYPFKQEFMDAFVQLEKEAREAERGLWASEKPQDHDIFYCTKDNAIVLSGPGIEYLFVGVVKENDSIIPVEENEEWFKFLYKDEYGWSLKSDFSDKKAEPDKYWYNSNSGVLHNSSCRWFGSTKQGYYTDEEIGSDCGICGGANRIEDEQPIQQSGATYWINSKSNVRHNSGCRWYGNTKKGYYTNQKVGKACGICGG